MKFFALSSQCGSRAPAAAHHQRIGDQAGVFDDRRVIGGQNRERVIRLAVAGQPARRRG